MQSTHQHTSDSFSLPGTIWIILIAALSVVGSLIFACAAPLAAIAALAAISSTRSEGAAMVFVAWLANQVVGFTLHGYPTDASTIGWGFAIGAAALFAYGLARVARDYIGASLTALCASFAVSFVAYQLGLFVYGLAIGYQGESFTASIIGNMLAINAVAFVGFLLLHRIAVALSLLKPSANPAPTTA